MVTESGPMLSPGTSTARGNFSNRRGELDLYWIEEIFPETVEDYERLKERITPIQDYRPTLMRMARHDLAQVPIGDRKVEASTRGKLADVIAVQLLPR